MPDLGVSIQIKESIGEYDTLETFLLHDSNGIILQRLKNDLKRSSEILDEIFDRWVRGEGQVGKERSNTWEKLVEYLRISKLHALADKIESVLKFCSEKSVESNKNSYIEDYVSVHEALWFYLAFILTVVAIIAATIVIIIQFHNECKISLHGHWYLLQNICTWDTI